MNKPDKIGYSTFLTAGGGVDSVAECTSGFYLPYELLGDRLVREGKIEAACEAYNRALELKPSATWIAAKRDLYGEQAPWEPVREPGSAALALYLFMPFYTPKDPDRANELLHCLDRNLACDAFARITLLVDDETPLPRDDPRLRMLRLGHRPTYLDWIRASRRICPGRISVLANSDMYFDDSVTRFSEIFAADPKAFIALSRFDKVGDKEIPHRNPHWSQDTWAFIPAANDDEALDANFGIPLGHPRCDNKIAYLFSIHGYSVYNPFPFVRSVHVHETNLRFYDKTGDRRISGGMAMLYPGTDLLEPAKIDIEVWSSNNSQYKGIRLNPTFERWNDERRRAAEPRSSFIAHDADWQYPAVTEKHAFDMIRQALPSEKAGYQTVYLAFPFATLIDLLNHVGLKDPRTRALQERLDQLAADVQLYRRVVTVAQHIHARKFASVFARAGVTDLFWSHSTLGETTFGDEPGIRVYPFPLYPVQQVPRDLDDADRPRTWLFSFVGARANASYLTESRKLIIDILGSDERGKVIDRDNWHYQRIVYDHQILARAGQDIPLINDDHTAAFRTIIDDSVFTLCPSGSGPNSIRLWEAALNGSIPVILADTWAAPGPSELWEEATIRCPETSEAIRDLPNRLAVLASDSTTMRRKRSALAALVERYGPAGFVNDILPIFSST